MNSFDYIDNDDCLDPYTNLAMEEYVLRHMNPGRDYLMFYRNDPSVVIGRNQNIFEEINVSYVRENDIHVVRRLSGGGAVYHDHGNLNFSFVTRYEQSRLHNFRFFNEPVVKVLRSLGVPAELNDRSDILACGRKISGNAQFSSRGRMFSHGTLLFNTHLDEVERTLAVQMIGIRSRSHKSVRSVVANILEFLHKPLDIHRFRELLLDGLRTNGVIGSHRKLTDVDRQKIRKIREQRYNRWEWNVGRSPRFNLVRTRQIGEHRITIRLEVEKGVIRSLSLKGDPEWIPEITSKMSSIGGKLTGLRYEPEEIERVLRINSDPLLTEQIPVSDFKQLIYSEDDS